MARRVARVVGNNAYAAAPLLNPVNDARAMAASLQAAGFAIILRTDATQPQLLAALREFGNWLKDGGPGTARLFYIAGHGMQVRGRNFLVPVGANIEHEDELAYQALDAQAVMDKMESADNGTHIVILDACRNNPFVRSFRSARQGLAQMDAPVGSMVAFSTAPGSVASDGSDATSGQWMDWQPTLPLAAAATQPVSASPIAHGVASTVQWRNADGQVTRATLRGQMHGPAPEAIPTPAGLMRTRRVDAFLDSAATLGNGASVRIELKLSWWFAAGVGLPGLYSVEERQDDRLLRRQLHEVTALDVLSRETVKPAPPKQHSGTEAVQRHDGNAPPGPQWPAAVKELPNA